MIDQLRITTRHARAFRFAAAACAATLIAAACGASAAAPSPASSSAVAQATLVQATLAPASAASATAAATAAASAAPAATASSGASSAPATGGTATAAPTAAPATAAPATDAPATAAPATAVPPTAPPATTAPTPPPATSRTVAVTLTDSAIILSQASAPAGPVTFVIKNAGYVTHELIVLQTSIPQDQLPLDPTNPKIVQTPGSIWSSGNIAIGATVTQTLTLAAGPYDLICNIANHYHDGMHAGFTVTP